MGWLNSKKGHTLLEEWPHEEEMKQEVLEDFKGKYVSKKVSDEIDRSERLLSLFLVTKHISFSSSWNFINLILYPSLNVDTVHVYRQEAVW
jgi:hypothetical protein